jgi:uncharacterized protein
MLSIASQIASELKVREAQVQSAIDLIDGGATVPFIARYRKEATGGLDDVQLRELEARLAYLRELHERRAAVLKSIDEQGKLTPALRAAIDAAPTKQELEDLYLPYKPRRRTKGQIAKEWGIEPLADRLWIDPTLDPQAEAQAFVKPEKGEGGEDFTTTTAVLDGVRDILSERWAEDAALVQGLREWLWAEGLLQSKLAAGKNESDPEVAKFRDYFDYDEPIGRVPSHRALAVFRGRQLQILDAKLVLPEAEPAPAPRSNPSLAEGRIALHLGWSHQGRPADELLRKCVAGPGASSSASAPSATCSPACAKMPRRWPSRCSATTCATCCWPRPPAEGGDGAGPRHPHRREGGRGGRHRQAGGHRHRLPARAAPRLGRQPAHPGPPGDPHGVQLIAIGNGTASRETDKLAGELIKCKQAAAPANKRKKLQDGCQRGRRLGLLGQRVRQRRAARRGRQPARRRQHRAAPAGPAGRAGQDRPQEHRRGPVPARRQPERAGAHAGRRGRGLRQRRGRGPEHRQQSLLARVSGLSAAVAKAVVRWREQHGAFANRQQLLQVSGLGPKLRAKRGLLRIRGGDNPLDMTGVHPETYAVVEQIILKTGKPVDQLMGRAEQIKALKPEAFATPQFGAITVRDILAELESPGATRAGTSGGALQRRRRGHRRPARGHGAGGHRQQRGPVRRFRRPGRAPGRPGARQPAGQPLRQRRARGRQDRPDRQGQGAGGGRAARRISLSMKLDALADRREPRGNRFEAAGRSQRPARRAPRRRPRRWRRRSRS